MLQKTKSISEDDATRLGRIIEDSLNEVYVFDCNSLRFELVNRGARENLGYSMEELRELTPVNLKPLFTEETFRKHVQPLIDGQEQYLVFTTIHRRKNGSHYDVEVRLSISHSETKSVFFAIIEDITERLKIQGRLIEAKEEADRANKAKSDFLAAMSHDLRTPLNAILGFSKMIHSEMNGPTIDKYIEYAKDIERSGNLLLTLIDDLLDISAIDAGEVVLKKEEILLPSFIDDCLNSFSAIAKKKDIDIINSYEDKNLTLIADKTAVERMLNNLVSNAIKFTPQKGRIVISYHKENANLKLSVEDNGIGMSEQALQTIHEPFTQADDAEAYVAQEGWGLGLAIVKSLMELHQGNIDITSTLGLGTKVTLNFPQKEQ